MLWQAMGMKLSASDFPEVPLQTMHNVHIEEVEMINVIYTLLDQIEIDKATADVLDMRLDELLLHTKEHFANEERLMQEARFPPYPVHKGAHDLFLAELEEAVADWKQTHQIMAVAHFMRTRLPDWMQDHIATMDFVTARFLAMQA